MEIEDKHQQVGHALVPMISKYITAKNKNSDVLELISVLSVLTGQLTLKHNAHPKDRLFEIFNAMKTMCESNDLHEATLSGVDISKVEFIFISEVLHDALPEIEKLFKTFSLTDQDQEIAALCAVIFALAFVKSEFNEDVTGMLPYLTRAMITGSQVLIQ